MQIRVSLLQPYSWAVLDNVGPAAGEEAAKSNNVGGDIQDIPLFISVTTIHAGLLVQFKICKS